MSNINYDIYGAPDTWRIWSDSPTSDVVWGACRIGAANFNNADFTDYPATKTGYYDSFYALYNNGRININEPVDNSVAYTAIANPELPQMNIGVFSPTHASINDPLAVVDKSKPLPFALGYFNDINSLTNPTIRQTIQGFDGFPNNATVMGAQALQRWAPFGACQNTTSGTTGYYNPSGYIFPILSWGIKSVFFEINVRFRKPNNDMEVRDLKSYLNHTTEWLQENQICGAWLKPYYRINVNGEYSNTHADSPVTYKDRVNGINPIFYAPYKCAGYDVYNYTGNYARNAGCLPIWGICITDGGYSDDRLYSQTYNNPTQTTIGSYAKVYGYNKGNIIFIPSSNYLTIRPKMDLSIAENVEYIMKGAAAYGMFFCQDIGTLGNSGRDSGATERWLDPDMYCGIIEDDGMTYGNYTRGEGNKDNQVYGWKDSTQTPFDPSNIPDTDNTHYDDETKFNHYGLTACSCNQYVVYENDVVKLADIIATAINTRPDPDQLSTVDYALNNGLTNNPVDTIISVRAYPARSLPITQKIVGGVLTDHEPLHCGAWYNNDVTGYFLGSTFDIISFSFRRGTNNGFVAAFDNSFLDYAPYTRAELIIPYCGTVQLNPADFLNHDINVKIIVDYITGICTAFVMRENVAVMTVSGSMGIDVPITGLQNATYDSQRLNAVFNRENANANNASASVGLFGASVGLAASVASGNVVGAIASVAGIGASIAKQPTVQNAMEKANYELTHQILPTKVVQSGSPMISYVYENCCRLIVYRPVISDDFDPAVYADTVGFACLINGTVSQFTGLTMGTIDTAGVNCTEKEKEMIQKLFAGGVYL